MRRSLATFSLALALLLGAVVIPAGAKPAPLEFVERVLGAESQGPLPLLVALHGLGDTPERFSALFDGFDVHVRLIAPRAPDPYAVGTSWFPIDDRTRAPAGILDSARRVAALIEQLRKSRAVRGLPIVTGFSQGGYLSFALAAYHSEHLAAALPIAGALPEVLPKYKKAPKDFRVIAFHGTADRRVSLADGERTVAQFKKSGIAASLTSYPGVGHTISPTMERDYVAALREELARLH